MTTPPARLHRREQGLSLKTLAKRAGLSPSYLQRAEWGGLLNEFQGRQVARIYGCDPLFFCLNHRPGRARGTGKAGGRALTPSGPGVRR